MSYGERRQNKRRRNDDSQPYWVKNAEYMEVENFIEPLIDRELFDVVQEAISSRNVNKTGISGRAIASPYLLTGGIAYCTCGRQLSARKKWGSDVMYYMCRNSLEKGSSFCDARFIRMEKADSYVLSQLDTQLLDENSLKEALDMMLAGNREQLEIKQNSIKELEEYTKNIQNRMESLDKEYLFPKPGQEQLSTTDYNRMMNMLREQLTLTSNQLESTRVEVARMITSLDDTRRMEQHIEEYRQFDKLSIDRQKALLRELLAKVEIYMPKGASEPEYKIVPKYINQ